VTFRTGDLTCPDVDVDAFKASCRVPLYPNQWNTWEVWVSTEEIKDEDAITNLVRNFMRHVFAEHKSTAIQGTTLGPAEYLTVSLGPYKGRTRIPGESRTTLKCEFLPTVRGTEPMLVTVAFVFRGTETDWPWPTLGRWPRDFFSPYIRGWCPIDAIAVLEDALQPIPGERVPEVGGTWQDIKDEMPDFSHGVEVVGETIKKALAFTFSRAMFFAGGLVVGGIALWKWGRSK